MIPNLPKRERRAIDGILILDKPIGMSSNQALQKVKWLFQAKKAGHTGSLDVLATGLLPICFGRSTKLSQSLLDSDKHYVAVAQLGGRTKTGDAEGDVIDRRPVHVTDDQLQRVLEKFRGDIVQIPPMYSALKFHGKPLYQLARQGIEIERKPRTINIYSLNMISSTITPSPMIKLRDDTFETAGSTVSCHPVGSNAPSSCDLIAGSSNCITLDVRCSKGTYIRTLVEDIGEALGCGAYTVALRRIGAGPFTAEQMITLPELERLAQDEGFVGLDRQLVQLNSSIVD
ncbi:MAG: tRNA pseudouridine(55) synthase TruB [Gammaproteobacteria bacterium GWF2_41_13]|nr:MAG: tRNA pseudouridine(55) synthase TruB [Gammaproteobacteria bacterium GWF2_41_13]